MTPPPAPTTDPAPRRVRSSWRARRAAVPDERRLKLGSGLGLGVVVLWFSLLVLLPMAAVVGKAFGQGWQGFWSAITGRVALNAVLLTVVVSLLVALINAVLGAVTAWVLVRDQFPGKRLLDLVIDIPFALPTIVAGVVMLALYGGDSPVGIELVGTRIGIFVALLFVTLPFTVRTVQPVLLDLERDVEEAAASLGASRWTTLRRVVLPPLLPGLVSGAALAFARAMGEYGSIVLISSNKPNSTLVASAFIYNKLQDNDNPVQATQVAAAVSTLLLLVSVVVLLLLQLIQHRGTRRG